MTHYRSMLLHQPEDVPPEKRESMCPSCRIRWQLRHAAPHEMYSPWRIDIKLFKWIENAARNFDAESDEKFTATEFVAWIKPEVVDSPHYDAIRELIRERTSEEEQRRRLEGAA